MMNYNELKTIYGEFIYLRPIHIDDTNMVISWRNCNSVRRQFLMQEELTKEMHMDWMRTKVYTGKVIQYIITVRTGHKPIGSIYLRDIDENNSSAEIGIFIGEPSNQGKGYGKEAMRLLSDFALNDIKLHKIYLRLLSDNERAFRAYCSVGFEEEGVFRDMVKINGVYRDVKFMSKISKK